MDDNPTTPPPVTAAEWEAWPMARRRRWISQLLDLSEAGIGPVWNRVAILRDPDEFLRKLRLLVQLYYEETGRWLPDEIDGELSSSRRPRAR